MRDTATHAFDRDVSDRRGADLPRGSGGPSAHEQAVGSTPAAWIDRSKPIWFTFDGAEYEGFEGDTLASALLANGVDVRVPQPDPRPPARRSSRPGVEEPNAFVEISEPWFDPIVAATDGARSSTVWWLGAGRASDASAAHGRVGTPRVGHR